MPIIALTANAAEDVKAEALNAGMDDFLTKPVSPEELAGIIGRYSPVQG
jgi:CheY-like chemotaxis protein